MVCDALLVKFAHPLTRWRLRLVDLEGYHRRIGYADYVIESQRQSYTTYANALCIMRYEDASTAYLGRVLGP